MKKTICVVTGSRAEYGILYSPIVQLKKQNDLDVRLVVTGTHLSKDHGNTVDAIIKDSMEIDAKIDIDIKGDRPSDIVHSMGKALNGFSEYFSERRPDLVLILGDRYEIFSVAQAALVHNIPVAHIHGGEVTEGAIDDAFRHAITKISYLHLTSTEQYRLRVIQMGESPDRVFSVGAPGLDNIKNLKLLSRNELENNLNCSFGKKNILVTFHPVTISEEQTLRETNNFFNSLSKLPEDTNFFITLPNADTFSAGIKKVIASFESKHKGRTLVFESLGTLRYLSLMNEVDLVAGNSSSGIIEAPFLNKAVVNVGDRQKGRSSSKHVIHVGSDEQDITNALIKGLSSEFKSESKIEDSIYGDGHSGERIAKVINDFLSSQNLKKPKSFRDLTNIL